MGVAEKVSKTGSELDLFVIASRERRRTQVSNSPEQSIDSDGLSPEQRLEPPNTGLLSAGIVAINDMETLRACVAYENAHQQRIQILRRLEHRASELRSQED